MEKKDLKAGDKIFVIYRNPHAANVAHIKEAEVVQHPSDEDDLAMFLYDSYHLLTEDDAIFGSYEEAEVLYNELFDIEQYQ
ncbi:transcriptional regulator [Bacillus lacus]|uniref:Transcriptional regulator n=1 Tax=Metabacillus lacus TaxID=1983721 RepID=A0A7X2IYY0_9BACI|nr:transcriptional regulator SplA domain-containing protein [Metabacillus lacus]MRX72250.1 transcriptional regulator [Metabacillus lacus]